MNPFKREKMQIVDFNPLSMLKHIHRVDYVNMGAMSEENIFLEAEGEEPDPSAKEEAPKTDPKPAKEKPPLPKTDEGDTPPAEGEAPEDPSSGADPFAGSGDSPDKGSEQDELLVEGLPKDDQYYVILLKNINKKISRLNVVSLKLLNKNNEADAKIIDKVTVLEYVFNRFIEQYSEYENPKVVIIKMQKLVDSLVIFVNNYIKMQKK